MAGTQVGWSVEDLVAFECALARDESVGWSTLKKEDAAFLAEKSVADASDRRQVARRWLSYRLKASPEIKLAADALGLSLRLSGQLLGALGLLLGLSAATAALAYNGDAPINVSAFFSVFVLLQALLAALLLLVFLLPASWREGVAFGPLFKLGRWVLERLVARLQRTASGLLSGKQRQDAGDWAGAARRSLALHGSVAKWAAFAKLQAAGLFFNLGALLALLVSVVFSDRAFGWQTTLEVEEAAVHRLVEGVAAPWAWLWGEGEGFPTQEQVAGSRIVLKDGIKELASGDLAAWWRFLALGIVVYGALPRALFYGLGLWQTRLALGRYDFRNASAERLMRRLFPERTRFDAERVQQGSESGDPVAGRAGAGVGGLSSGLRYLCSAELGEAFGVAAVSAALAERWRVPRDFVSPVVYQDGRMAEAFEVAEAEREVAVVFESWMPPIRELERQVKALRDALGERVLIKVVLIGIPEEGQALSLKPDPQYGEAWNSFVRRLGDPYLVLENPPL